MSGYSNRKLGEDEVDEIRTEYATTSKTYKEIAEFWGVHASTIGKIMTEKTYKSEKR